PACHLAGSKVSTKAGSPYAVEVLVKRSERYEPQTPHEDKGFAFVELAKNDVYGLRLHNDSPHEAAVKVTVDGLSMFRFANQKAKNGEAYQYVIIPPRSSVDVKGWFIDLQHTDEFRIVPLGTS